MVELQRASRARINDRWNSIIPLDAILRSWDETRKSLDIETLDIMTSYSSMQYSDLMAASQAARSYSSELVKYLRGTLPE